MPPQPLITRIVDPTKFWGVTLQPGAPRVLKYPGHTLTVSRVALVAPARAPPGGTAVSVRCDSGGRACIAHLSEAHPDAAVFFRLPPGEESELGAQGAQVDVTGYLTKDMPDADPDKEIFGFGGKSSDDEDGDSADGRQPPPRQPAPAAAAAPPAKRRRRHR
eukprot:TRINITY_DN66953_c0_g1_i1.p3 TRINITY_DN66953_c0_g1~~TRINITY_DN66953_c0_g1_i1.p3  ORF type:complete len:189 (+),score=59.94 TRINITY_DN66953_c0_g1_i1:84-569(+)